MAYLNEVKNSAVENSLECQNPGRWGCRSDEAAISGMRGFIGVPRFSDYDEVVIMRNLAMLAILRYAASIEDAATMSGASVESVRKWHAELLADCSVHVRD